MCTASLIHYFIEDATCTFRITHIYISFRQVEFCSNFIAATNIWRFRPYKELRNLLNPGLVAAQDSAGDADEGAEDAGGQEAGGPVAE